MRHAPIAIFAVAFALRAVYLLQSRADPLHDFVYALADSLHYHRQALALLDGKWVGDTAYFLGPLYAWFLAPCYALFGPSLEVVRWVQALLGAGSCVVLQRIGTRLLGERVGALAGLLLALYGLHIYYTGVLLPTVLVVFLNLAFLLLLLRALEAPTPGRAAAAGAVLGLAILAKSNALLVLPVALAFGWWRDPVAADRRGAWCAAFAAASLLLVAPATLHNWAASERFVPVTTSTGRNLWKGNGPHANGTHPLGHREGDQAGLGRRLWGEVDPIEAVDESGSYTARTLRFALDEPGRVIVGVIAKTRLFFSSTELFVRDNYYFAQRHAGVLRLPLLGFALIAPLGLAGMFSAWRRRPRPLVLYALFAVQALSFIGVFVLARYRLVAVACLMPFAAYELLRWIDAARARDLRAVAPGLVLAAAAAILVSWPIEGFPRQRGFALQYEKLGDMYAITRRPQQAVSAYRLALDADWQDLDPALKQADTRLRMARAQMAVGDAPAARETLDELLESAPREGTAAERVRADALGLLGELP